MIMNMWRAVRQWNFLEFTVFLCIHGNGRKFELEDSAALQRRIIFPRHPRCKYWWLPLYENTGCEKHISVYFLVVYSFYRKEAGHKYIRLHTPVNALWNEKTEHETRSSIVSEWTLPKTHVLLTCRNHNNFTLARLLDTTPVDDQCRKKNLE